MRESTLGESYEIARKSRKPSEDKTSILVEKCKHQQHRIYNIQLENVTLVYISRKCCKDLMHFY